ncbi:MAG: hypothetical protein Pg6A_18750 [Termitinemataceae bacterium]|nr:MAG: hypothetical protein Pg6A_18750 [Termitinemataceae bacterium]
MWPHPPAAPTLRESARRGWRNGGRQPQEPEKPLAVSQATSPTSARRRRGEKGAGGRGRKHPAKNALSATICFASLANSASIACAGVWF